MTCWEVSELTTEDPQSSLEPGQASPGAGRPGPCPTLPSCDTEERKNPRQASRALAVLLASAVSPLHTLRVNLTLVSQTQKLRLQEVRRLCPTAQLAGSRGRTHPHPAAPDPTGPSVTSRGLKRGANKGLKLQTRGKHGRWAEGGSRQMRA